MQRQGGGALTCSVAVHWVYWPCGSLCVTGQGQPLPVFCLRPPCLSIKQSEMVATYAGLRDSQAKPSCESRLAVASTQPGAT